MGGDLGVEEGKGKRVNDVSLGKKTWGSRVFIMANIHKEEDLLRRQDT
jgi:hypothetical protein